MRRDRLVLAGAGPGIGCVAPACALELVEQVAQPATQNAGQSTAGHAAASLSTALQAGQQTAKTTSTQAGQQASKTAALRLARTASRPTSVSALAKV